MPTHTDVVSSTHVHNHMEVTTTDPTTTTHPAFQPSRIQMSTMVVASYSPLVAGKEIINRHNIESSSGFFSSILYTSTEPHTALEDR